MGKKNRITFTEPIHDNKSNKGNLTVNELQETEKNKHKINKEIYRTILSDCEKRIKSQNSIGNSQMIIRIPFMLFDKPLYNITHAMMYVIKKLKENGFTIVNIYENNIQIKWR